MAHIVRKLVSKKKKRYDDGVYNLDLSYITERIIAMGFPSENFEGLYRNKYADVLTFLDSKHRDHYMVYNLCSERSYPDTYFHGRVRCFPFDDHRAPPLKLAFDFCVNVHSYLREDPKNIVAIHCKAGKGRTGTFICCYMLWTRICKSDDEALSLYGRQRTLDGKGVTIPSQKRYIYYFWQALQRYKAMGYTKTFTSLSGNDRNTLVLPHKQMVLKAVEISCIPKLLNCELSVGFSVGSARVWGDKVLRSEKDGTTVWEGEMPFWDDMTVDFFHHNSNVFSCYVHAAFMDVTVTVPKEHLDKAFKDKSCKIFPKDFTVTLRLDYPEESDFEAEASVCTQCRRPVAPGEECVIQGDKVWHAECLACSKCRAHIHKTVCFDAEDKPICSNCAAQSSQHAFSFCERCDEIIDCEMYVFAAGRSWHIRCFTCSECGNPVPKDSFTHEKVPAERMKQNGKPTDVLVFCPSCTEKKASMRRDEVPCKACGELLEQTDAVAINDEEFYHNDCFVCCVCGDVLDDQYILHDGNLFCVDDYIQNFRVCHVCGGAIWESPMEVNGMIIHPECLKCSLCSASLDGLTFFQDSDTNAFVCENCLL